MSFRSSNPTGHSATAHAAVAPSVSQPPGVPAGLARWVDGVLRLLEQLQPLAQLAARWHVAQAFFLSGLTKLRDWDITLALFEDEYHVPLLSPEVAAVLGTGGELILPVLLMLGLAGRLAAAGLFVVNGVAVLSLSEIAPAALQQHVLWGALLIGLLLWGPGRWSVDAWLRRRWLR